MTPERRPFAVAGPAPGDPTTTWTRQHIDWYGGRQRLIEYVSSTALWYAPGYDPMPIRWVLVRDLLGEFEATAFFATDQTADPLQILNWFIMHWGLEVTFEEAPAHLGLETQRQWSDQAIQHTTPALLGLFSRVTLLAHRLSDGQPPVQTAACIPNGRPPFPMRLPWSGTICGLP